MNIEIYKDSQDLAAHAADLVIASANEAIAARGRFVIALAGGRTPKDTYMLLAQPERSSRIDWNKVFAFFGDERFVSYDSPDSNYGMARKALLSQVPIPKNQIYPMPIEGADDEYAPAEAYQQTIASALGASVHGLPPVFDLILLGLGDDGHTASLFPGAPSLAVTDSWVAATPPGILPPSVDRLTFTFPILNAARHVAFLVSGAAKADIVRTVVRGTGGREAHPSEGVQPSDGKLTWMLDKAAAANLSYR